MSRWHTGRLLVASPTIDEPTFARTVVLVLDHDEDGALGVVLNRASAVEVTDALAPWASLAAAPPVVFGGGPVEPTAVVALGDTRPGPPSDGATLILDRVRLVDLDQDPALAAADLQQVRLFAGYAGWAPDQLEDELADGAWFPVPASAEDVFTRAPDGLWKAVLRRQPGPLRLLSTYPVDPSRN